MTYNPIIRHRRSIRLKGYDYSKAGLYFITICVHDRKCLFGEITNHKIILNEFGEIAYNQWAKLPDRFSNFELDVFQIMPNHMHGIILLDEPVGATLAVAQIEMVERDVIPVGATLVVAQNELVEYDDNWVGATLAVAQNELVERDANRAGASPAPTTIGNMVGAYKSLVANDCLEQFKLKRPNEMMGKLWQRNYYEHIIRDEKSYKRITDYIINNPSKWKDDKFYNPS